MITRKFALMAVPAFVLTGALLFAQEAPEPGSFIRGAVLDSGQYVNLPRRAELAPRSWQTLPPEVSLKKYAPIPGDQTPYGTCVAWAAAYGARTISESVLTNRHQTRTITGNVYSPVFLYKSINDDPSCLSGAQIFTALDLMKEEGTPRMLDIERTADFQQIGLSAFTGARRYAIADYVTLFRAERAGRGNTGQAHVQAVKKSLAEQKPVIIGMNTPESFAHALGVWQPHENPHRYYGGHAMVVVGYDDNRYGGAFEVLNSWGKKWGNGGYIWISYETFGQWVREAYEIIENLAVWSDTSRFSGFIQIEAAEAGGQSSRPVSVNFNRDGYYTAVSMPPRAEYRLQLGNTDPAWLYVFSLRESGMTAIARVFPPEDSRILPVLDYAESYLALPGEDRWIPGMEQPGNEYLILLYSKQEINITPIRARLAKNHGAIAERVALSVGADVLPMANADYKQDEIRFAAESDNPLGIFALIIKIERLPAQE